MAYPVYKPNMTVSQIAQFERDLTELYTQYKGDGERDLSFRVGGVSAQGGSSGYQFVGYKKLEQFSRGDQWAADEPDGASQRTDNYCAVIIDNFSSLTFDAPVEINCPAADENDDILELKAELKEKLLHKVYDDNDADEEVFPNCAKVGSTYGDSFIKGPFLDKCGSDNKKDWKIVFYNVDDPASIIPIFSDSNHNHLEAFIDRSRISPTKMKRMHGKALANRGINLDDLMKRASVKIDPMSTGSQTSQVKMIRRAELWTDKFCAIFLNEEIVDWYWHDWGFLPLQHIKNIYVPNYPYGKSDIEDAIDPQLFYTRVNNDLANALKFLSSINLKGKNLDGMEVMIHGLNKIFNIPDDGELDAIDRSGDPYATGNFVSGRRQAVLDVSGVSEALMSSVSNQAVSGRSLALGLQSVIRRLNPRYKAYRKALKHLNENILKLYEIYWPETKDIIMGDYRNEVSIISTILRNIVDELNKLQAGTQSLTTTMKNLGVPQPKIEQKRMKHDLMDPVLGPQTARQPGALQLANPMGNPATPGSNDQGLPAQPGKTMATPEGAVAAAEERQTGTARFIAPPSVNP